jgi:murein DD-endopeptidase MepM/ murein hydrolase activator NlpD
MPVQGRVTSNFGPRRYRIHKGTDIDLETGDTIICAFDGVVRVAEYSGGYGNVVVVRHFNGLETIYAHLSKMEVRPGTPVEAGSLLGLGGRTGRATGSHLHFEVRYMGLAIDSRLFMDYETGTLRDNELCLGRGDFAH